MVKHHAHDLPRSPGHNAPYHSGVIANAPYCVWYVAPVNNDGDAVIRLKGGGHDLEATPTPLLMSMLTDPDPAAMMAIIDLMLGTAAV